MRKYNIVYDGRLDYEFGSDNAETSREIAAKNNIYLEMNNLDRKKPTLKRAH